MIKILNRNNLLLAVFALFTLTACGGGEETSTLGAEEGKTFTISASSIVIKRISNDEPIAVDISGINSERLTLKKEG